MPFSSCVKAVQLHLKSIVFRSQKQCYCKPKAVLFKTKKKEIGNEEDTKKLSNYSRAPLYLMRVTLRFYAKTWPKR